MNITDQKNLARTVIVGVVSAALMLSATSGFATAVQPKDASVVAETKTALAKLELYKAPVPSASSTTSLKADANEVASRVSSSEGLVVPSRDANGQLTIAPVGTELTASEQGLNVYQGQGFTFALTDKSTGVNAGYSIINSSSAPTSYTYKITAGGKPANLSVVSNGGVIVKNQAGKIINLINAPWATDANGKAVKTNYSVKGNMLTQNLQHLGAAYPVVADPRLACDWMFCTVQLNKAETATVADAGWGWSGILAAACALAAGIAGVVCGALGGVYTTTAQAARNQGKCLGLQRPVFIAVTMTPYPVINSGGNCR